MQSRGFRQQEDLIRRFGEGRRRSRSAGLRHGQERQSQGFGRYEGRRSSFEMRLQLSDRLGGWSDGGPATRERIDDAWQKYQSVGARPTFQEDAGG